MCLRIATESLSLLSVLSYTVIVKEKRKEEDGDEKDNEHKDEEEDMKVED